MFNEKLSFIATFRCARNLKRVRKNAVGSRVHTRSGVVLHAVRIDETKGR
jgi:hypothetical protein